MVTKKKSFITLDNHKIAITNPEKILFPKDNITKGDIIMYYHDIAPIMVPYMKDRCVSMLRYPNGINHEGFFQKDASDFFPSWIKRKNVENSDGSITHYVVCNNPATLVYLANLAVLTPHIWLSTINKLNFPDRLIFDLDPSGPHDFALVKKTARMLKEFLEKLDLTSFVMTTGSRGLHVVVPLDRSTNFETVRAFARHVAEILSQKNPDLLTIETRKEKRGKRLLIDYLRNSYTATGVSPYAVRAHPKAPVATPLRWEELSRLTKSTQYTIKNIFKKLDKDGDAWEHINKHAYSIKKAQKKLEFFER